MFSFSASQLRTAVHTWPFCHHLEFETLRIEVHFCSLIAHLSFAPKLIFGHFWSCAEVHFWLFLIISSLYLCIYVRYVSLSVRTYVCMFLRMYVCMYVWSSPNFTPSLSKRFDYRRKAGCFCPSPAQRVDFQLYRTIFLPKGRRLGCGFYQDVSCTAHFSIGFQFYCKIFGPRGRRLGC